MKPLTIDTLKAADGLQSHGFSSQQAEGLVEFAQALDASEVATKGELALVNLKLNILIGMNTAMLAGVFITVLTLLRTV